MILAARLEAIAGMAKTLAHDVKYKKLWDREAEQRLQAIREELERAFAETNRKQ